MIMFWLFGTQIYAQSVEVYAGHQRAGVDLLWFKNFMDAEGGRTPWLFFSRNRANTNYDNAPTAFGSTNAISYNFGSGLGIVAVGSFLNAGFAPKAGVQYYHQQGDFLFFGWWVADLRRRGNVDVFGMFRYQPKLNGNWRLFAQAELFPVFNPSQEVWSFTERVRVGPKYRTWAAGFMADFQQTGRRSFATSTNIGGFLRHDF